MTYTYNTPANVNSIECPHGRHRDACGECDYAQMVAARPEPEMVLGPVYGLRVWSTGLTKNMTNDNGLLTGAGVGRVHTWIPGWNKATCKYVNWSGITEPRQHPTKQAPEFDCTCGFYSCKTWEQLEAWNWERDTSVWGVVEFKDRVIEYTKGHRAETARIAAINDLDLARLYCVPFVERNTLAKDWGIE